MRDTLQQRLAHRAALTIERADGVVVQKRTILRRKTMILAQLPDQRQSVAQTSREHEFRVFAALDAGLDEFDQTQNVDIQLMFLSNCSMWRNCSMVRAKRGAAAMRRALDQSK